MNEQDWRLLDADRPVEELRIDGWLLQKGDRVLLRPRARGDVFDLVLDGKAAAVESIEQDLEGNFLVSVVLEEDPGAYLGLLRQPGHRFFFSPQEVAPLPPDAPARSAAVTPSILVAGIGNIFLGDDGFGVEVAQRLARPRAPRRGDGRRLRDPRIRPGLRAGAQADAHHPGGRLPARRSAGHRLRARARPRRPGRGRGRARRCSTRTT